MTDPLDPPLGANGPKKKAGLTKPERLSQKRSLPPPPPSAVRAAKEKSLPPLPPSVEVNIEDSDDETIVQDREAFAGFFDAGDAPETSEPAANNGSPWSLPEVTERPVSSPVSAEADAVSGFALPVDASSTDASAPDATSLGVAANSDDVSLEDPFSGVTEQERTQEVDEVEEVTFAGNEKPEPIAAVSDDLDALFGPQKHSSSPFAASSPSNGSAKAPPPPPSLKPPPPPPLKASAPPPLPPPPSHPRVPVADAYAAVAVAPEHAETFPRPSPLPPALLPPASTAALPPLAAPPRPSAPPEPDEGLNFQDDDVTAIFDRGSADSLPPIGMAPRTSPAIRLPSFIPEAPSLLTFSDPPPDGAKKLLQRPGFLAGLVAALVVLALLIVLWPSAGRLVVAVAGPNGTVVDGIEISVDGKVVCTSSPCQVSDLEAKSYLVAVTAEGFERTAPQAVIVRSGEDAVHNVTLQAPLVVAPTGLDIPASTPGLELSIDGRIHGTLPQRVLDLTPGEHVLRVSGGDRYRDQEKVVNVIEGQVLSLQPFALEVKRGRAIIEGGSNAEEATVKLDGRTIRLPHTVDLDASRKHKITATREGYENFEQEVTFDAGRAERTFTVALSPADAPSDEAEASEETSVGSARPASTPRESSSSRRSVSARSAPAASSAGKGTLNITSTPSAMVILDGRPIGKTPRMGVKVSPGAHSIVFVSDKGRKRATTKVAAGASKTVSVRF